VLPPLRVDVKANQAGVAGFRRKFRMAGLRTAFLAASALALCSTGAPAQERDGRFTMVPTADGFLRLDGRTGVVSQCVKREAGFRCDAIPDERHALQDEIDRLSRENAELRTRLEAATPSSGGATGKPAPSLPSDAELDRALSLMERALRRFKDIMREPQDGKPL
jgi:hypothetical protein